MGHQFLKSTCDTAPPPPIVRTSTDSQKPHKVHIWVIGHVTLGSNRGNWVIILSLCNSSQGDIGGPILLGELVGSYMFFSEFFSLWSLPFVGIFLYLL